MRFEYNKNLVFHDRVLLVAKEIKDEYPLLSTEEACIAASFATPVDDKLTNDDKFDRYYFILRTIGKNSDEFSHVFNDAYNVYSDGLKKDIYNNVMFKIIDYATGDSSVFPELVDC